jgi:hypothetical protein
VIGGACRLDGGGERRVQGFGGGNLREREQGGSSGSAVCVYGVDRAGSR